MLKLFFSLLLIGGFMMAETIKTIRQIEGISEYKLPNGFSFLLFPDQQQSTITVNITIKTGSSSEGLGEKGMALWLEHMLFKGTPQYPSPKGELQGRGAFFNATTWL